MSPRGEGGREGRAGEWEESILYCTTVKGA